MKLYSSLINVFGKYYNNKKIKSESHVNKLRVLFSLVHLNCLHRIQFYLLHCPNITYHLGRSNSSSIAFFVNITAPSNTTRIPAVKSYSNTIKYKIMFDTNKQRQTAFAHLHASLNW